MSAPISPIAAAHERLAAATAALAAATRTTEAARSFAAQIAIEVVEHKKRNQELA